MSRRIPPFWLAVALVLAILLLAPTALDPIFSGLKALFIGLIGAAALGLTLLITAPIWLLGLIPILILAFLALLALRALGRKASRAIKGGRIALAQRWSRLRRGTEPAVETPQAGEAPDAAASLDALVERFETADGDPELAALLRSTAATIRSAAATQTQRGLLDETAYVLRATATDYLPSILDTYLRIPRAYRDRLLTDQGQTPNALLRIQLETIHSEMKAILDALVREDVRMMQVHSRFLEQRFARDPSGPGTGRAPPADSEG
jgi:hypothetical protein